MKKNNIGRNSLIISIIGLVTLQVLLYIKYLENDYWHILSFGFEAATIGGFADWFAVKALFKEIPIPFVRSHTNIIVKSRTKLSSGIVDLVSNKWLSTDIIKEKISNIPVIPGLVKVLKEPKNKDKVSNLLKQGIQILSTKIDDPKTLNTLQNLLKNKLNTTDIAVPMGEWLEKLVEKGEHDKLFNLLLETSDKTIKNEETQQFLLALIKEKIKGYKKENLSKGIIVKLAEVTGAIDSQAIVDKIMYSFNDFITEAKNDENHPLRLKFDNKIIEFVNNLKSGNTESIKTITNLKDKIINNDELKALIKPIINNLKAGISKQLKNDKAPLSALLKNNIDKLSSKLETDEKLQDKINITIKETIDPLVDKYHHEIGALVANSLSKLNDDELVNQIESKVGNDLQYIRLNGAIVGGFVGLIIAFIRVKFLHS